MMIYANQTSTKLDATSIFLYTIEGLIIAGFNLTCATIIFTTKLKNQKENVLIAIGMIFDVIYGISYAAAGIWRMNLLFLEYGASLVSPWECLFTIHSILLTFITPGTGVLSFLSSLDRFLSVVIPIRYSHFTTLYSYIFGVLLFIISIPPLIISIIQTSAEPKLSTQSKECMLQNSLSVTMFTSVKIIRITLTLFGIFLYFPVACKVYGIIVKHNPLGMLQGKQRHRLRRMTISVLFVTLNQLILIVIPDIYVFLHPRGNWKIFYLMNLNRGMVNIIIFCFTQRSLFRSIKTYFLLLFGIPKQHKIKLHHDYRNPHWILSSNLVKPYTYKLNTR